MIDGRAACLIPAAIGSILHRRHIPDAGVRYTPRRDRHLLSGENRTYSILL
ncbi:hypothetical protein ASZ90_010010 [hydrocarbon metagenome]|uniref:Uncharacterized protein n=1 Tax=hydrocarbon metagenome TaxID=938273 RepID=A0A0W8FIZ1_9ZZZZ